MDEVLNVFRAVLNLMSKSFDSHEYILMLLHENPVVYFSFLREAHERVSLANAQISSFLFDHQSDLRIEYQGKHDSLNVYLNITECAVWKKSE